MHATPLSQHVEKQSKIYAHQRAPRKLIRRIGDLLAGSLVLDTIPATQTATAKHGTEELSPDRKAEAAETIFRNRAQTA